MSSNSHLDRNSSLNQAQSEPPVDELHVWLERLSKSAEIKNALEVSSSGGNGTTQAFIKGLSLNPNKPRLFCIEAAKPRFEMLKSSCAGLPWVQCLNESSVPAEKFPARAAVEEFYKTRKTTLNDHGLADVLNWLEEDRIYVEKSGVHGNGIAKARQAIDGGFFDLVLIDGSEFLGEAEVDAIYGAKYIVLDDVLGYKNFNSRKRLLADSNYALIAENFNARNGYSIFKRTGEAPIKSAAVSAPTAAPQPRGQNIRIAGQDDTSGKDLTQIDDGSSFADAIREIIRRERPRKIIETGTYLGTGTTKIIAAALREFAVESPEFFSIEVNPNNFIQAQQNLAQAGLSRFVRPLLGVSVPRTMLPTIAELEEKFVRNIELSDVYIDHKEHERAILYYKETDFRGIPEDLLRESLARFDFKPDFVLLDSGGHMGNIEFNYLLSLLRGPCFVALDDVFHVKHALSFKQIKNDPRFVLLTHGKEKFGFALAHFDPTRLGAAAQASSKEASEAPQMKQSPKDTLVWVRSDSIGDAILSSGMLEAVAKHFSSSEIVVVCQEHIAELYKNCPYVKSVVTFNRRSLEQDQNYLEAMAQKLLALNAKIVIQSTFSRDMVGDFLTMATGAPKRIAPSGDNSNVDRATWEKHTKLYTDIVPIPNEASSELERHKAFLNGLGFASAEVKPTVWIGAEDREWARRFYESQGIDRAKTVFLFAGAQHHMRLYERYGEALAMIPELSGCTVIALGNAEDSAISARNLRDAKLRTLNLCGHTTLLQAAALLEGSRAAFGAETGLMHMACALNLPNAVLLGGGHFGRFMPYSAETRVAAMPLDCFSCNWQCRHSKAHCVADVSPGLLSKALKAALMGGKGETYFWEELREPSNLVQGPPCSKAAIEKFDISAKKQASEVSVDKTLAEAAAMALMNFRE